MQKNQKSSEIEKLTLQINNLTLKENKSLNVKSTNTILLAKLQKKLQRHGNTIKPNQSLKTISGNNPWTQITNYFQVIPKPPVVVTAKDKYFQKWLDNNFEYNRQKNAARVIQYFFKQYSLSYSWGKCDRDSLVAAIKQKRRKYLLRKQLKRHKDYMRQKYLQEEKEISHFKYQEKAVMILKNFFSLYKKYLIYKRVKECKNQRIPFFHRIRYCCHRQGANAIYTMTGGSTLTKKKFIIKDE